MSQEALIQAALGAKFAATSEAQSHVVVEAVPSIPTLAPIDTEKTYVHTLQDGREVAGTFEQARMLCPVIGAMSVESAQATLNDADFAQRIAERGRLQREAAEREKQLVDKPLAHVKVVPEAKTTKSVSQKQTETVPPAKTQAQTPTPPSRSHVTTKLGRIIPNSEAFQLAQTANHNAVLAITQRDPLIIKSTITSDTAAKPQTKPASTQQARMTVRPEKPTVVASAKTIKKIDLKLVSVQPRSEKPNKVANSAVAVKTVTPETPQLINHVAKDVFKPQAEIIVPPMTRTIQTEAAITIQATTNNTQESEYLTSSPYELHIIKDTADDESKVYSSENQIVADTAFNAALEVMPDLITVAVNTVAQPETHDYFDEEIIQTYEQLLYLIDNESDQVEAAMNGEKIFTGLEVVITGRTTEENTPALANDILPGELAEDIIFEDLILLQPKPEQTLEFYEITKGANEQSLEETLFQVCVYLDAAQESVMDSSLNQVIADLAVFLPARNSLVARSQEIHTLPTLKMTQKLVLFLETIGYPHPQEVLALFIKKYSWEFLLQALQYIYKLSKPANQQEFLYTPRTSVSIGLANSWGIRSIASMITKLLVKPHIELLLMPQTEHKVL